MFLTLGYDHQWPRFATRPGAVGAVATATLLLLAGCASTVDPAQQGAPTAADQTALGHVHGLGVDPGDDTLYVASHLGVFRLSKSGAPERIADRWQDTMGFAVIGPGHFLGSGHPDLREDLPPSLGLIESTDGAQTWEPVSLQGDADLHAIEVVGDRIYACDSHTGSLITTTNRTDWDTIATLPLYDLAASPAKRDRRQTTTTASRGPWPAGTSRPTAPSPPAPPRPTTSSSPAPRHSSPASHSCSPTPTHTTADPSVMPPAPTRSAIA